MSQTQIVTQILHKKSFGSNVVSFSTAEGKGVEVNKYFLLLYNDFFGKIVLEGIEEQLVFIFDGYTIEELEQLRNTVVLKHFKCEEPSPNSDNNENYIGETTLENDNSTETVNIDSKNKTKGEEKLENPTENVLLKCPFNCESNPENDWTVDTLYAHIFCSHFKKVEENYFVSVSTFLKKLKSKISNKCAFNCEESKGRKNKNDYINLKTHYIRCHIEDPKICENCGETFRNPLTLKIHTTDKRCKTESKECSICGDGKKHKYLRDHLHYFHKPRNTKCQEDECSKTFRNDYELQRHIRTVHKKEKNFVCDQCGTKMNRFANLSDHRLKVHGEKFSFKEYKQMILSGKNPFIPTDSCSRIPTYQ